MITIGKVFVAFMVIESLSNRFLAISQLRCY